MGAAVGTATGLVGLALIYSMSSAYRLRTVPTWDSWATPASFFLATFLLGALATAVLLTGRGTLPAEGTRLAVQGVVLWAVMLLGAELVVVSLWLAQLTGSAAARSSALRLGRKHGVLLKLRLALSVAGMAAAGVTLLGPGGSHPSWQGLALFAAFGLALVSEVLGRSLFYSARVRHGV